MQEVITDDEARKNIAKNVARLRTAMDISRYRLAKMVGVHTIQISRIEDAEHAPGVGLLARIAEALGSSADTLMGSPRTALKKVAQ